MFGFLPTYVEDSLLNIFAYNAFPVEVKFDSKGALKSSWCDVGHYIRKFGIFICILGAYCSFLTAFDYEPYKSNFGRNASFYHGFYHQQLVNNLFTASECSRRLIRIIINVILYRYFFLKFLIIVNPKKFYFSSI